MPDAMTLARALIELGADGVAEVEGELRALELQLGALGSDYRLGKLKVMQYVEQAEGLRKQVAELRGGLAAAESAIANHGSAQAAAAAMSGPAEAAGKAHGSGSLSAWSATQVV